MDFLNRFFHRDKTEVAPAKTSAGLQGPHFIVGLGNPGPDYADTRHNAGFKVIDALASEFGANYWKTSGGALYAEAKHRDERIVLIKPQRFMNDSGPPVRGLLKAYGYKEGDVSDLLVVHDELDLPDGVNRLKQGGGHAGHRGILSISQAIGPDYARLRVGVGRPPGQMPAVKFVLQPLSGDTLEEFEATVANAVTIAIAAIETGVQAAMNRYNRA
jgi:PTH1 family peptidyl-tRNA hydrolase